PYDKLTAGDKPSFIAHGDARQIVANAMADAGYDGIRYNGGQRTPLMDEAGNPIQHTAIVVFPESLPTLRNALSGQAGGINASASFPKKCVTRYSRPRKM